MSAKNVSSGKSSRVDRMWYTLTDAERLSRIR
jgi:hypothetical protein